MRQAPEWETRIWGSFPCPACGTAQSCRDCRWLRRRYRTGYIYPPGLPLRVPADASGGTPCSDCCHALFGRVREGQQQITANWPCRSCGRTAGQAGGYHYAHNCGTQHWAPA